MVSTIDANLVTLLQQSGSFTQGFTATAGTDYFTNDVLTNARFNIFGDRASEGRVVVCHPLQMSSFISSVGGLSAFNFNAIRQDVQEDGFYQGRFNGVDFYISSNVPSVAQIAGKNAYIAYVFKQNPFGVMMKQIPEIEYIDDKLGRRYVLQTTSWYGTLNLHAAISPTDLRTIAITTVV